MKKALAGALGGAALVAARPASADPAAGVLNVGYIFSAVAGPSAAIAHGVEGSYVYYHDTSLPFGFGPLAQWQSYGGGEHRWALGGQFNVSAFGGELGFARRDGDGDRAATNGVHVGAFFSVGLLHVALRTTVVPDPPPASYGPEFAFTLGIKLPLPLPDYPTWPFPHSMLRVPSGRPLRVDGAPRVASLRGGRAWGADVRPRLAGLGAGERAALAERWARDAQAEHASVAAFSRLSLELLALGAPPELVEATPRAALDEVRHARLCFALASAYAGSPLGAGELPLTPPRAPALPELARESYVDGCLGEATAAALARDELRGCDDPEVAAVLRVVARDEARHAKLAWQIVAWCLRAGGPEVERALRGAGGEGPQGEGREARCHARVARAAGRRLIELMRSPPA